MSLSDERDLLNALLLDGAVPASGISKKLTGLKEQLCLSGAAFLSIPAGKRSYYLQVRSREQLERRLSSLAVVPLESMASVRARSIQSRQDSKKGGRLPYVLLNVLGSALTHWSCPAVPTPSALPMMPMGFAGLILEEGVEDYAWQPHGNVVLVENREAWITLGERLPPMLNGAAIIRYEGWLSKRMLSHIKQWTQATVWLFADFDPVGFSNLKSLRELGVNARMLIPVLDEQVIKTCTNDKIWQDNLSLVPSIAQWICQAHADEQALWRLLSEKGTALEHEVVVSLEGLKWQL